jgi:hypothetical protein
MDNKPQLKDEICDRLAKGEPLRQICRDEHMPSWRTVYDWINADEEFASRITRARDLGFDAIAEECFDIADNATNDWMERRDKDDVPAGYVLNGDHVQRSKLRIETRLKLLAKWNPKKYGDRQDINLTGKLEVADAIVAARKRAGQNTP